MGKKSKLLFHDNEWTLQTIDDIWDAVRTIADKKYKMDFYPPRFEVIDFEGMLNAYSTIALPGLYNHSSFGKQYVEEYDKFKQTHSLAFEVVINSNPSVCYLMDSNTATMQTLVIAHAAVGHSSFFKHNHMFKKYTNASTIIPYLARSAKRIEALEAKHGWELVDMLLTRIHALRNFSFDKLITSPLSRKERMKQVKEAIDIRDASIHPIHDFSVRQSVESQQESLDPLDHWGDAPSITGDNVLKFIAQNSPNIHPLTKELIELFLPINQYLFPQMHTQLMNEGWASFWHYTLMKDMYEEGYINESSYWEFIHAHTAVLKGYPQGTPGLNPYKLGFDIYQDIKRISLEPTDEDKDFFPDWAGNGDWINTLKYAANTYKDESFVSQYLSPKVIRDYKLMTLNVDWDRYKATVVSNHDSLWYDKVINEVSRSYDFFDKIPQIECEVNDSYREELILTIPIADDRDLTRDSLDDLKYAAKSLWNGNVTVVRD